MFENDWKIRTDYLELEKLVQLKCRKYSNVSSNSNQSMTIIIYLFSFIEIKIFSQMFLKEVSRESKPF